MAPNTLSSISAITTPQAGNSNTSTEATILNGLAGTSFTGADLTQGPSDPSNPLIISSGPIVGAGLPSLIAACGGLVALRRRRRQVAI